MPPAAWRLRPLKRLRFARLSLACRALKRLRVARFSPEKCYIDKLLGVKMGNLNFNIGAVRGGWPSFPHNDNFLHQNRGLAQMDTAISS